MAKDKDRTLNPAAAQRKLEKQKALKKGNFAPPPSPSPLSPPEPDQEPDQKTPTKKNTHTTGKATVLAQRTSRLAARNPVRLERQIAELKGLEREKGLGGRERKQLEDAERDLARVKKARETVGTPTAPTGTPTGTPTAGAGRRRGEMVVLGKRRRRESSESTDESVRGIPMPRDTPPPPPRHHQPHHQPQPQPQQPFNEDNNLPSATNNANFEPLGHHSTRLHPPPPHHDDDDHNNNKPDPIIIIPIPSSKSVYESKPVVRDLRKEAVQKFVPVAVQRKLDASRGGGGGGKGAGRLLEEEEISQLEKGGYGVGGVISGWRMEGEVEKEDGGTTEQYPRGQHERVERRRREEEVRRLREEEERFEQELAMEEGKSDRAVTMEEVQDEHQ